MVNYEYGITAEPSSYNTQSNKFEMGWRFVPNIDFYFYGFRVKFPVKQTVICRLWDCETQTVIIEQEVSYTDATNWQEVKLTKSILLSAEKRYLISTYNTSTRYYYYGNYFTFNDKLTYETGMYGYTEGVYPTNTETSVYPMIDILLADSPLYTIKMLVESEGVLYTQQNGELIAVVGDIVKETFETLGVESFAAASIASLTNPRILAWTKSESVTDITANITGVPLTQVIVTDAVDMTDSTVMGIEIVTVTGVGEFNLAVSIDEKQTWQALVNSEWVNLSSPYSGISKEAMNLISSNQWAEYLRGADHLYFRIVLFNSEQHISEIKVDFIN